MTDYHHGNTAFQWTRTFFCALQQYGVQHVVISPGSRSTPLTLAAASTNALQKHVILDERSAAFTALGIGKATNIPAVLICTSGTALANYYPAVIEARQSGIPMILATADRPPTLRATGANQAIDQLKIFGDYPVFFHEVSEPRSESEDLDRVKLLGQQAVNISREKRGPVHLNFPFRKPLEPEENFFKKEVESWDSHSVDDSPPQSFTSLKLSEPLQQAITKAKQPLIVVGPLAPKDHVDSVAKLADRINAPVLTEASINCPTTVRGFAGFLRNDKLRTDLEPDLILRFGFQPTTKALEWGLRNWQPDHHYHFASTTKWQDATYSGAERIPWMGQEIECSNIDSASDKSWFRKWKSAEKHFGSYYQKTVDQESTLTDGVIYQHLTPQIPETCFIAVSNSFPARDIQLFGRQSTAIPLYQNRGASGIDGISSTAIGLSLGLNRPGVLFTGDLAFLHDTNAQLNRKLITKPLTIVVINNAGGSIFRMLPITEYEEYFESYFETPQSVNIGQLASSYGIPYRHIDSLSSLHDINLQNWMTQHNGLSVIECKTDAEASMYLRKKLWDLNS